MPTPPSFADVIRLARAERGLSVEAVAAAAGWVPGQLDDAERGRYMPTPDQLWRLAHVLDVPPETLAVLAADGNA